VLEANGGRVARAEAQRRGGRVRGYLLRFTGGKRGKNIEHRTSKGRGMLDFEF
jgi:hypothetical protein